MSEIKNREDKEPRLSDLKDSGDIEQHADVVLFVYRPHYYDRAREKTRASSGAGTCRSCSGMRRSTTGAGEDGVDTSDPITPRNTSIHLSHRAIRIGSRSRISERRLTPKGGR